MVSGSGETEVEKTEQLGDGWLFKGFQVLFRAIGAEVPETFLLWLTGDVGWF